jgi:hypothetical protein
MTTEEEYEADFNKIDVLVYISVDWGEKGPPSSQLDKENHQKQRNQNTTMVLSTYLIQT